MSECVDLCKLCRHAWKTLVDRLFNRQLEDIERTGRTFLAAVTRSLAILYRLKPLVVRGAPGNGRSRDAKKFIAALSDLTSLEAEVRKSWPFVDYAMIKKSRDAYHRGEYQTTEDILHALQGHRSKVG
jgi:hypothetical protein